MNLGIEAMRSKIIEGGGVMVRSERQVAADSARWNANRKTWLPDGHSQIFRSYVFGPSGFWTMALLRCAAKFDPFLSLDCAPTPSTLAQYNERKGSNFAIWHTCRKKAFNNNPTESGEENKSQNFSLFLQKLRRFGTSFFTSPTEAISS